MRASSAAQRRELRAPRRASSSRTTASCCCTATPRLGLHPRRLVHADGLPTWGDGRLVLLGTEGYIELRKYVDIAGRPGTDHLFLVDGSGVRHIDCSARAALKRRRVSAPWMKA
jgi:hypothetical protein